MHTSNYSNQTFTAGVNNTVKIQFKHCQCLLKSSNIIKMTERETIQNIAIKIAEEQLKNSNINGPKESTIFILGSNGVVSTKNNKIKNK